jgi:hypothetical protein
MSTGGPCSAQAEQRRAIGERTMNASQQQAVKAKMDEILSRLQTNLMHDWPSMGWEAGNWKVYLEVKDTTLSIRLEYDHPGADSIYLETFECPRQATELDDLLRCLGTAWRAIYEDNPQLEATARRIS